MDKKNFAELLQSLKESGKIMRGEMKPSCQFVFEDKGDIQEVRQGFNADQGEFAQFMGVSIDNLQNWEQGRRHPTGPAKMLLRIAARADRDVVPDGEAGVRAREGGPHPVHKRTRKRTVALDSRLS